jgi:PAS domain S-box-containing protein
MGKPLRALLLEDSDCDAGLLVRDLECEYEVEHEIVRTACELRDALERGPWDVILSDIATEHLTATDALAILKDGGHDLPFIIVSGAIGEEAAVAALKAGAHDFLLKGQAARLGATIERELRVAAHRREQRRAEEALRRSEAQYRSLVDHAVFGIYRATVDGRFLSVNPALVAMLGYDSADELMRVDLASLYAEADPGDPPMARGGSRLNGAEAIWKQKSGASIRVRLTGHLTEQRHTGRPQFEVIVENVTEQYGLQEQLRVTQKMEALGQLAGGVAHDFNNVLTAILGYTEILADEIGPDKPIGADLRQIKAAADRATVLTRQLLAFSRKQVLAVKPVDLTEVVRSLDSLLSRVLGAHITIDTKLSEDLPRVMGDEAQLEHLLISLAVNARDAMPKGGVITISTRPMDVAEGGAVAPTRREMKPGAYAALTVADEGIGMSRDVQDKIFEPFFTTKERGRGTGLGLSAVYGTVKQLGGYIEVESQPSRGSRFTIYLPATEYAAPSIRESAPAAAFSGHETILLVDDEPGVRTLAKTVLERAGYHVLDADSAEMALAILEQHDQPIDLLLTDLVLPGLNGHELAIRVALRRPNVRRLFTSGYAAQLGPFDGFFGPGVQVLEKPFSGQSLLAKTREVLAPDATPGAA